MNILFTNSFHQLLYLTKWRLCCSAPVRKEQESWPLVQLGPGIITLNATEDYSWDDFSYRIDRLIENFFESYPDPKHQLEG
ncbi:TIGR04255 family protein [Mesotoga sp.]|uniref:TIGR04255 family protein n=1 Tax=Mesotoga sp. TaxID=2053577 RepID=UPI00345E7B3B